jgi:dihydrofolate reductase
MRLSIVVAMDSNRLIGKDNGLPWHLPADLAFFKKLTTGNTILMGRKTFDSIGRPLPNRRNIVITRNADIEIAGCEVVNSIEEALSLAQGETEVMVIGGAKLYQQILPIADRLYITQIESEFDGDTYFPSYNEAEWFQISLDSREPDEDNHHKCHFITLDRSR